MLALVHNKGLAAMPFVGIECLGVDALLAQSCHATLGHARLAGSSITDEQIPVQPKAVLHGAWPPKHSFAGWPLLRGMRFASKSVLL